MRVGSGYDLASFNPLTSAAAATLMHTNTAYNRLLKFDGPKWAPGAFPGTMTNDLVSGWEQKDATTFVFTLAPNIKWQPKAPLNSRPFVAADVVYALDQYKKSGPSTTYMRFVDSVQSPDAKTVVVKMKKPFPDQIPYFASRYLTIFPKELVEDGSLGTRAIGTGAMMLSKAIKGERVTYERNPEYFRGKVPLQGLDYIVMTEGERRQSALRSGQVDLIQLYDGNLEEVAKLAKEMPELKGSHAFPVSGRVGLCFQLREKPWDDVRVRRAISQASNLQLWGDLMHGKNLSYVGPNIPWSMVGDKPPTFAELGPWYQFNPKESAKLLSAAGAEGLAFNMNYYDSPTATDDAINLAVRDFTTLGLKPKVVKTDSIKFNEAWTVGKHTGISWGWKATPVSADDIIWGYYHKDAPDTLNRWGIKDAEATALVDKQATMTDVKDRREVWKQIWARDLDQMWYVCTPDTIKFNLMSGKTQGFQFDWQQTNMRDSYEIGTQIESAWLSA